MGQWDRKGERHECAIEAQRSSVWVLSLACGAMLALGLFLSSLASASVSQVGTFAPIPLNKAGEFPEDVQMAGVGGLAVNISGAGGVPAGTLYAATRKTGGGGGPVKIARYNPDGSFNEAWEFKSSEGSYEICGPDAPSPVSCEARPEGQAGGFWDVDVDQATGNVYVLSGEVPNGKNAVAVYSPDGSEVIARFGLKAPGGVTTASTPEQIHTSDAVGGIAVNASGEVYVFDLNGTDNFYHRLMVFKPKTPGNYTEYEYAEGKDIGAGFLNQSKYPMKPVVDANGDIYVVGNGEETIEKYDPDQPTKPICTSEIKGGGITSMTVNPANGEVFYFSYKKVGGKKRLHQLAPCKEGKFEEPEPTGVEVSPERGDLYGMVFNPEWQWDINHAKGTLYAAAPGPVPTTGGTGQPGTSALGYVFAPVPEDPPVVESESVDRITATSAELQAVINPKSSQTSYRFQYMTDAAYDEAGQIFTEPQETPIALIGGGGNPLNAAAVLTGLEPDTGYHFRVIATSGCKPKEPEVVCEDVGDPMAFRTFPALGTVLPDARAYELVSPPQKNGGEVVPAEPNVNSCGAFFGCKPGNSYQHFPMQSAPDGNSVAYEGSSFFPGQGALIENEYLGRRTAGGWQTTNLTPQLLESKASHGYKFFDQGLGTGIVEQVDPPLDPAAAPDYPNLYRQPTGLPSALTPLLTGEPLNHLPFNRPPGEGAADRLLLEYAGASNDFSRIFFEANDALTEESPFAPEAIDGGLEENNLYEWSGGQLRLVNVAPGNATTAPGAGFGSGTQLGAGTANIPVLVVPNAISDDGSRAFWTSKAGQLFVRENGETTKQIPTGSGKFLAATPTGSAVLLSDGSIYDLGTGTTTDLTATKGGFLGVAGHTEDLSQIYFVDTAVLDEAPNDEGDVAAAGKPNLYAWNGASSRFIGTLVAADELSWEAAPTLRMAEASPSGRYLTFLSRAPLTEFDNVGPCKEISGTGEYEDSACDEVYLYDSVADELVCASCNPTATPPRGPSILRQVLGVRGAALQPRYLTDSGRLYFDSQDALAPGDRNGRAEDVYQYEPNGVGSCKREGGCVALISAGREEADSNFVTMDSSGDNVFFSTRDRLVPADSDELMDLYDARVEGGIGAEGQLPPLPCQGEACQPAGPPAPPSPPPGSQGFNGSGNHKPPKCKKGQVKRSGKCVKKKQGKNSKKKRAATSKRGGAR